MKRLALAFLILSLFLGVCACNDGDNADDGNGENVADGDNADDGSGENVGNGGNADDGSGEDVGDGGAAAPTYGDNIVNFDEIA